MNKIVECVPNFSEGRDQEKVDLVVSAIVSVPDVVLLDRAMDADHNRAVITFAGEPDAVVEAAFRAAAIAVELIDLNQHTGAHPRMGAIDVLPFVPLIGVTMDECIVLARHAGERIARELHIPVYLYEKAATRPERIDLANIRRGEFEGLRDEIKTNPNRYPDFGEPKLHPTAGATAVGARDLLIAYNVNLATEDLSIARKIARAVRGRDGGLHYLKALGMALNNRHQVQVSMNLIDYQATPIFRAFDLVKREAERYGVAVASSEIVGLAPQAALNACSDFYLRMRGRCGDSILERRMQIELAKLESEPEPAPRNLRVVPSERPSEPEIRRTEPESLTIDDFAEEVAAGTPTLAGGSVAAYAGALAASLGAMVCNLTIGQKASVEAEVRGVLNQLEQLSADLRLAVNEEAESRASVLDAIALPRDSEAERLARTIAIEEATKNAISVPQRVAQSAMVALELLSELSEVGNPTAFADLAVGAQLAISAMRGAAYTILSQLLQINDDEFNRFRRAELSDLITRGQELSDEIEALFFRLFPR